MLEARIPVVLALFVALSASATAQFGPQLTAIDLGLLSPRRIALADLDGDGDRDIMAVGGAPHSQHRRQAIWMENRGDGVFARPLVIYESGAVAQWIRPGDLDADGDLDIVVATDSWNGLPSAFVFYRNDGGGEFVSMPQAVPARGGISELSVVDLDGNVWPDLLFSLESGGVWAQYGAGAFSFGPPVLLHAVPVATGARPVDLDQDGDLDVLVSSMITMPQFASGRADWLENLGGANFVVHPIGSVSRVAGSRAFDLDGDGDLDVAFAGQDGVTWFPNDGTGFTLPPIVVAGVPTLDLDVLDVDLDGLPDFAAIPRVGQARWHQNLGSGAFGAAIDLGGTYPLPTSIEAIDLDGDGRDDLVLAGRANDTWYPEVNVVGLHINSGAGGFLPLSNVVGSVIAVPHPMETVDMDADGDLDLLVIGDSAKGGGFDGTIGWVENDGTGQFRVFHRIDQFPALKHLLVVDLDADGWMDILAAGGSGSIWLRGSATGFGAVEFLGPGVAGIRAGDVDGDGDLDLVLGGASAVFWRENLGGGMFGPRRVVAAGRASGFDLGDFDGDNVLDLVVASIFSQPVGTRWYQGLGGGSFGSAQVIPGTFFRGRKFARAADMDADGSLDIVCGGEDLLVAFGDGQGGFTNPSPIIGGIQDMSPVALADLDGDGLLDIVSAEVEDPLSPRTYVALQTATGFDLSTLSNVGKKLERVAVGDLDGDGDVDVLTSMPLFSRVYWHRNGNSATNAYCRPTRLNSTGEAGRTRSLGSVSVAANNFALRAEQLPPGSFGYFLVSATEGHVFKPAGSDGSLCLGGTIGRFNRPGEVVRADAGGMIGLSVDLTQIPQGGTAVAVMPGETWRFQLWHRDGLGGAATSNFTDALAVRFE